MADMVASIGRPPVVVRFGENTAEALRQANLAQSYALLAEQAGNAVIHASWMELAAATGTSDASAIIFDDAGTHTDPVAGGTVPNAGIYRWSTSPAGWKRVADTEAVRADQAVSQAQALVVDAEAAKDGAESAMEGAEAASDGANGAKMLAQQAVLDAQGVVADVSAALAVGTISDLVGTRIYASKALLDADLVPADDEYALVVGDPTPANNDIYQKNGATTAGSWDGPLGIFASASAVAEEAAVLAVYLAEQVDDSFAIVDDDGQRLLHFDASGRAMLDPSDRLGALIESRLSFGPYLKATEDDGFALLDADGQYLLHFDASGGLMFNPQDRLVQVIADRLGVEEVREPVQYTAVPAPWILLHFYGQSLSLGAGAYGTISGATAYPNLFMPDHGIQDGTWTGGNLVGYESLSSAIVPLDASVNSEGIEPPVVGAGNQLASRMHAANILCANAGRGGFGIAGLKKGYNDGGGSGPYALFIDQYQTYSAIAGAKPIATVLCWMQGEADANNAATTIAGYKTNLLGIRTDYMADTGQTGVHLVTYQFSSHSMRSPGYNPAPGLALGELGEERDDVSVALPLYFLDHNPLPDGVHQTAAAARLTGAYFGKAIDHVLRTGTKWQALYPSKIERSGAVITVIFRVPVGNLVVDTDTVSDPGDLGFEVFDSVSGDLLPIDDVYVFANKAVITLADVPANPVIVGYALGSTMIDVPAGRFTGPRGCLRDEGDTRAYFDARMALPNWCLMFKKEEGYGA